MKRYVRANKYQDAADKKLNWILHIAEALPKIANASSDAEYADAISNLGLFYKKLSKEQAIDAALEQIVYLAEEYKEHSAQSASLPHAKEELLNVCREYGYDPQKLSKCRWGEEAYRLDADAEFGDHHRLCKAIQDKLGVKFDTGLGGSWTAHSSKFKGIDFTVGFEDDLDLDPTGKTSSLQIYF